MLLANRKLTTPENLDDRIHLEPPTSCFCTGRAGSAVVWWDPSTSKGEILEWEIRRHRQDLDGRWRDKVFIGGSFFSILFQFFPFFFSFYLLAILNNFQGCSLLPNKINKSRIVIEGLTNGFLYRFTVRARSVEDVSRDSAPSKPVYIDDPLPCGWFYVVDDRAKAYYFINRFNLSVSSTRPDSSPYFIDHVFESNFSPHEIESLKKIYDEVSRLVSLNQNVLNTIMFESFLAQCT